MGLLLCDAKFQPTMVGTQKENTKVVPSFYKSDLYNQSW